MKNFKSLGEFAQYLEKVTAKFPVYQEAALVAIGKELTDHAKKKFGVYQYAIGPYPAWQQLAQSTQDQRSRLGYTPNDPLLRTGELLRDSINYHIIGNLMQFGSTSAIMEFHEHGTIKMPPRPVLGPTVFENEKYIIEAIIAMASNWLLGLGLNKYG